MDGWMDGEGGRENEAYKTIIGKQTPKWYRLPGYIGLLEAQPDMSVAFDLQ